MRGQVAWISGASGGIGQGIAKELAKHGVQIAVCYRSNKQAAYEVVQQCQELGATATAYHLDVRDLDSVTSCYQQISWSLGKPDIVIHAAGDTEYGLFQDMASAVYDRLFDVHVRGAYHMTQTALPSLLEKRSGRIILLSSIWGETGGAGEVLYSAAKGAINGMTKALGKELAPSGITVNAVAPGAISTPLLHKQLTEEEQQALKEEIPTGRIGTVEDVAGCVRFLVSDEASYITGQVLHVNGGWYT
ncbi:elongation factor P 5-aminopentanone reductase [Risungbinella massiliensis]|uniref:elongation factor P 5-aminopentanone reductase n=1 Tax=Risungbinella massiliensis TaxID=1329796 RepID=UPI0005CBF67B|nr:3-oxoacyl-ACP reductase FabG [Risungbinella massiliensis]